MTKEQWLVYLWSIYPDGGFTAIWVILLILFSAGLVFFATIHFDGYDNNESVWRKMGKW